MSSRQELSSRLLNIKKDLDKFSESKQLKLSKLIQDYKKYDLSIKTELNEIDNEVKILEMSINSSVDLAKSIIDPVKSKERIMKNISNTLNNLKKEREIATLLERMKTATSIEMKIKTILEANLIINENHFLFDNYKKEFIKESKDVMNSLETQFNKEKLKISRLLNVFNRNNSSFQGGRHEDKENKEINEENKENKEINLNESLLNMEKTSILIYKLTSNTSFIDTFYDALAKSFIYPFNMKSVSESNSLYKQFKINSNPSFEVLLQYMDDNYKSIVNVIKSFFYAINRRVSLYKIEFEGGEYFYFLMNMMLKLLEFMFILIQLSGKQVLQVIDTYDMKTQGQGSSSLIQGQGVSYIKQQSQSQSQSQKDIKNNLSYEYDTINQNLVGIISKLLLLKHFCLCADAKIRFANEETKENKENKDIYNNSNLSLPLQSRLLHILKNYDNLSYEIGERYLKYELLFIKHNITQAFKSDVKPSFSMESLLSKESFELIGLTQSSIEDLFYILKVSSSRAIETLDLQLCIPIFNHIKDILNEDLLHFIDLKLGSKLSFEYKTNKISEFLQYNTVFSDPLLSNRPQIGNLYIIICLNMICQCLENSNLLMKESKSQIYKVYFNKIDLENNDYNDDDYYDQTENPTDSINESTSTNKVIINTEFIFDNSKILTDFDMKNKEKFSFSLFKTSDQDWVNLSFQETDSLSKTYELYITKKIRLLIDVYLKNYIKSTVDYINQVNYSIERKNILIAELNESFASKFIDETEKLLKQWKNQLSEKAFDYYMSIYTSYICSYLESNLFIKKYSDYGVIILEKEVNKIINFLNSICKISVRDRFSRILSFVKVLNFENFQEIEDFMMQENDICLSMNEIERISRLKVGGNGSGVVG